jgi:hypothetical protein
MDIYRKTALDKLSSPEQLDAMLYVIPSRVWYAFIAVVVLLGIALLWGIFGSIPVTVSGTGILTRGGAQTTLKAPKDGTLQKLLVNTGDSVTQGQVLAVLQDNQQMTSPIVGRVLSIAAHEGDKLSANSDLFVIESIDEAANPLKAILFINAIDGQSITLGMDVQLAPSTVRTSDTGFLRGKVVSISQAPVSPERIAKVLNSTDLSQTYFSNGTYVEVQIDLVSAPDTVSGYQWSSSKGSPFKLQSGTLTSASIQVGTQRPISLLGGSE